MDEVPPLLRSWYVSAEDGEGYMCASSRNIGDWQNYRENMNDERIDLLKGINSTQYDTERKQKGWARTNTNIRNESIKPRQFEIRALTPSQLRDYSEVQANRDILSGSSRRVS